MKNYVSLFFLLLIWNGRAQVADNLQMVWNDEFNGNVLDDSKWAPCPEWPRQGGSYWSDNNYEMTGNGQVRLKVTEENGNVYCGAIRTHRKFDKKYGYFETRCTVPQLRGGWAAFWMMPYRNSPGNDGNDGTEIDVFESINGWYGKVNHALHWDGYGEYHQKSSYRFDYASLYDGNYHKFGVMWTPEEYVFYIDDVETWRSSAGGVSDVNQYMKLTMEVADGTWAGDWNDQVTKPIYWLVDYVRVYDYEPVQEQDISLDFRVLEDDETFNVGDHVQMHVDVTGSLSDIDEIKFFTQKGTESDELKMTRTVTTETTYWYNWYPETSGSYKLKAAAYKNGVYVTNVVANATVQGDSEPLSLSFSKLNSGDIYDVGDAIQMDVILIGDLTDADELQFLTKKDNGDFVVQNTLNVGSASSYTYSWSPTETGTYSFRVTANSSGAYVTHVVLNNVIVEEVDDVQDPLSLSFETLNSGDVFTLGDVVNMNVILTGDLSDADEVQFLSRFGDGAFEIEQMVSTTGASIYAYAWTPTEAGTYSLRVTANIGGQYVTHTVVGSVIVEAQQDPLSMTVSSISSGDVVKVADEVPMFVELSGNLADADELQFLTKKDGEDFVVVHTATVTDATIYGYMWTPTEEGTHALRVTANKGGNYVTHVVINNIVVERPLDPLSLSFQALKSGDVYGVDDVINMSVNLVGDLADADELQFLTKNGNEDFVLQSTVTTTGASTYAYSWTPTEGGTYSFRVTANKSGGYVTHVVVGAVTIQDPLTLSYTALNSGDVYNVGDEVKMHVELSGDRSGADEIRYILQMTGESASVLKSTTLTPDQSVYWNEWIPEEMGTYKLKVSAYKEGSYLTHVVANITVEDPLTLTYTILEDGQEYYVGDDIKMHVKVTGDFSEADEIKWVTQKLDGNNIVDKLEDLDTAKTKYRNKWTPTEEGEYTLKAKAYKEGLFVTKVVANVTVLSAAGQKSSLAEEAMESVFGVYPNPATDHLVIESENTEITYKIVDAMGHVVSKGSGTQVDVSHLSSGTYLIITDAHAPVLFIKE